MTDGICFAGLDVHARKAAAAAAAVAVQLGCGEVFKAAAGVADGSDRVARDAAGPGPRGL
jgi:hypothetical protein